MPPQAFADTIATLHENGDTTWLVKSAAAHWKAAAHGYG